MKSLPQSAKRLITWVSALASIVLVTALLQWHGSEPLRLAEWFLFAMVSGTLKVRFPRVESSYSLGYIVVLAALNMLTFSDTILISLAAPLVQSYWHATQRPRGIQVVFNMFNYVISAAGAWGAFHALLYLQPGVPLAALFALGAAVFFLLNTGLVAWILAILAESRFIDVWETSHLLVFPFYVIGAGCAALIASENRMNAWFLASMLPFLYLMVRSMRGWVRRAA